MCEDLLVHHEQSNMPFTESAMCNNRNHESLKKVRKVIDNRRSRTGSSLREEKETIHEVNQKVNTGSTVKQIVRQWFWPHMLVEAVKNP